MKVLKPAELFHLVIKGGSMQGGRLLGLDVGSKYVGLAVSDRKNVLASPLSVLIRNKRNIGLMAEDFKTLMSELSLEGLVVGLPYGLHGSIKNEAVLIRCFMNELCNTGKLDRLYYTYWDESFTSKCVEALLDPLSLHPVDSKTISDKFAAVGILQAYLDSMNREIRLDSKPKGSMHMKGNTAAET